MSQSVSTIDYAEETIKAAEIRKVSGVRQNESASTDSSNDPASNAAKSTHIAGDAIHTARPVRKAAKDEKKRRGKYNEFDPVKIRAAAIDRLAGMSIRAAAEKHSLKRNTLQDALTRYDRTGSFLPAKRGGRRKATRDNDQLQR